nr:MAG: RNA-dependent RNA polymerase [Botourmiaviridae sp.]
MKISEEDLSRVPDSVLFFVDSVGSGGGRTGLGQRSRRRRTAAPVGASGLHDQGAENPRAAPLGGCLLDNGAPPWVGFASTDAINESIGFERFSFRLKEWEARQRLLTPRKSDVHTNTYALLEEDEDDCTLAVRLRGKAITCVKLLAIELGLEPVRDLPPRIRCGDLRSAVRGAFEDSLPLEAQLSIKTTQKLERSTCRSCEARVLDSVEEKWTKARFQPQEVNKEHLSEFSRAMRENIPTGWNRRKFPFIPNGNASERCKRSEGGNWNEEGFSRTCRVEAILSSGKPRVVTLYSAHNSKVLSPLHHSLYSELQRMGWLLVGPPTAERIKRLNGAGPYLSFDFIGATDNIKQAYVESAVDALIQRAQPPLDPEQVRCLRVVSELRLDDEQESPCPSGQPMGSLMSFPILCLVNKTINDLALTDLLVGGQLSFKEWTGHRLMVNGDDLLTKEPRKDSNLADRIYWHGAQVGMRSNPEKTLRSETEAEINSTLFRDGSEVKKTNVASFYMKPETTGVLEYAQQATRTAIGFRKVVRANCKILSMQSRKGYRDLPYELQRVCKRDRKIRAALQSFPVKPEVNRHPNLFPVDPRPEGYDLSREEEVRLINERVDEVREKAIRLFSRGEEGDGRIAYIPPKRIRELRETRSWRFVKYEKKPEREQRTTLRLLARYWEAKQKERLVEVEGWSPPTMVIGPTDDPSGRSGSRVNAMVDAIRAFRNAKDLQCDPITPVLPWAKRKAWDFLPGEFVFESEPADSSEWIALE